MFETDEFELQIANNPGFAKRNLRRKTVRNSGFLTIAGGLLSFGLLGFFIAFIAALWVCVDVWVFWRTWCEYNQIKTGKLFRFYVLWLIACIGFGLGAATLIGMTFGA